MVHIEISMWPGGNKDRAYPLGEVTIANVGGTDTRGNYRWKLFKRGTQSIYREGEVHDFHRKRLGVYDLLYRVLKIAVGERNGTNSDVLLPSPNFSETE